MKKCPKCKAEIEENARFCLYCMTSFEEKQTIEVSKEKNKRWLIIIAAVLVLALIVATIFFIPKDDSPKDTGSTSTGNSAHFDSEVDDPSSTPDTANSSTSSGNKPASNSSHNSSSGNSKPDNSKPDNSEPDNDNSSSGSSSDASSDNTSPSPKPEPTKVTYLYRDAQYGDDFSVSTNLENCVVITGVKTAATDGKYVIPDTLDGKKVIAIMALAFCDNNISNTVKTVFVPSSVKTIWNNAFATCYNLTDIYFKGTSIYTESNAFAPSSKRNGTLTIHCSANCSDRNYRYYKNCASSYNAKYEEWNG